MDGGSGLTASRTVTPDARCTRGASQAATSSGRRLAVSRSTHPIALRMKNSFSSSIASAYLANRSKSPSPRRSGLSKASIAERRIQKSGSAAHRSSVAVISPNRSARSATTIVASPSTSAQVPEFLSRYSMRSTSVKVNSRASRSSSKTAACRDSYSGLAQSARVIATSRPCVRPPHSRLHDATAARIAGTPTPANSRPLFRYAFSLTARSGLLSSRSARSRSAASAAPSAVTTPNLAPASPPPPDNPMPDNPMPDNPMPEYLLRGNPMPDNLMPDNLIPGRLAWGDRGSRGCRGSCGECCAATLRIM